MSTMNILGKEIKYKEDYVEIEKLKFYKENPRVYSVVREVSDFDNLAEEEQQEKIYEKLSNERSVKNLREEIKRHGGLMEPIVVSMNKWEVIEGNSRLAVYKELHDSKTQEGEWSLIPCRLISRLQDDELTAYLSQIHIKGKTKWTAYEKANFAYTRFKISQDSGKLMGDSYKEVAELFGESAKTIKHRVNVIKLMEDQTDNVRDNFSYYDVLVRNRDAYRIINKEGGFNRLLKEIKNSGGNKDNEDNKEFTAQGMRAALPNIIKKPKLLKQYEEGKIAFRDAAIRAEVSECKQKVTRATSFLEDISREDIKKLSSNDFNAFSQSFRKLKTEFNRVAEMIGKIKTSQ